MALSRIFPVDLFLMESLYHCRKEYLDKLVKAEGGNQAIEARWGHLEPTSWAVPMHIMYNLNKMLYALTYVVCSVSFKWICEHGSYQLCVSVQLA
jgi:hypothetical protein